MRISVFWTLIALAVGVLGFTVPVHAGFMWNGSTSPNTGDVLQIHLTDYEPSIHSLETGGTGGVLFGVGTIDQIFDITKSGHPEVWSTSSSQQLTFTFTGFNVDNTTTSVDTTGTPITNPNYGNGTIYFTGGQLNVYFADPSSGGTLVTAPPDVPQGNAVNPDGTVNQQFNQGPAALQFTANALPTFNSNTDTLRTDIINASNTTDSTTAIGSGHSTFAINPNSGPLSGWFSNLGFSTNLYPITDPSLTSSDYQVLSSDPVTTHYLLPEPASLAIWSGLLISFGLVRRRRTAHANQA